MPHEPCVDRGKVEGGAGGHVSVISTVCAVSGPWLVMITV